MADSLEVITQAEQLTENLLALRDLAPAETNIPDAVLLSNLGGGLLRFTNAIFPEASHDQIYAEKHERESEGRGAHFDVYNEAVNPDYPWLGVYNLYGRVTLNTVKLPDDLAKSYFDRFAIPDEAAFKARRDFSSIALESPHAATYSGELDKDTGLVILQRPSGPHIVHHLIPDSAPIAGEFIKIVCPADTAAAKETLAKTDMVPLDQFLTKALIKYKDAPGQVGRTTRVERPGVTVSQVRRPRSRTGAGLID